MGVLVKQAKLNGIESLMWGIFWAIGAIIFYKMAWKLINYAPKDKYQDKGGWYVGAAWTFIATAAATLAALAASISNIVDAIYHFINPSYYALQEILQTLGK